jgi:azurin
VKLANDEMAFRASIISLDKSIKKANIMSIHWGGKDVITRNLLANHTDRTHSMLQLFLYVLFVHPRLPRTLKYRIQK